MTEPSTAKLDTGHPVVSASQQGLAEPIEPPSENPEAEELGQTGIVSDDFDPLEGYEPA